MLSPGTCVLSVHVCATQVRYRGLLKHRQTQSLPLSLSDRHSGVGPALLRQVVQLGESEDQKGPGLDFPSYENVWVPPITQGFVSG